MPALERLLIDYEPDLLAIIARLWGGELAATDRGVAAEELCALMLDAARLPQVWESLDTEQQQAMNDLLAHDGRLAYFHFIRRYGEIRPMGPARREREQPWLAPESITEALYYRGLIFRAFEQTPAGVQEYILVPSDLRDLLPQPEPGILAASPGHAVAPPRSLKGGYAIAPDDVATLLAYLRIRKADAQSWLIHSPQEYIDRHLRRPDEPAYRAFLTSLMYDLSLITDEALLTSITTQVDREASPPWLEAIRLHQLRLLFEAWRESLRWNDLAATPAIEAERWPNDPRLARAALLSALADVPREIWWSIDSLIEHIKQTNPDFQRPGGDYSGWYLRDAYSGEIMHGFEYWDMIEGALLRYMLEGPLHWLGLVRIGWGAFLITDLGLAATGRGDWPSTPDGDLPIKIDEQGVISVPAGFSRYHRSRIARFSAWISAPPSRDGSTHRNALAYDEDSLYQYRITPQALKRGEAEGVEPDQIIGMLHKLSNQSMPGTVQKMLANWREAPGEVVVQDVVIIRARSLEAYDRLTKNDKIKRLLGRQIEPYTHEVKREDFPSLLNALRLMGLLPLFEGHEKDDWP
jgi:hypothetical protein